MGITELVVLLVIGAIYIVPIVAVVWVLLTLHRLRAIHEDMRGRLESIERLLRGNG